MDLRKTHPKTKFTTHEDFVLTHFVTHFGCNKWELAASYLPSRSARQCRERWVKYLCPTNSFEPFTREEDELLKQLHEQLGPKWMKMSRFFNNRTDISLKNRWLVLKRLERRVPEGSTPESSPAFYLEWPAGWGAAGDDGGLFGLNDL
jgi:predicted unusual protein kinase regulating ubiquinone biosynthesis (AarF/ABC1/UbiB family)